MSHMAQGRYNDAVPLLEQALEIHQRLLVQEHAFVAASLDNLAMLYLHQGRYREAEPLFQQALKKRQQLWGKIHPQVAGSLNNLALLLAATDRPAEALARFRQASQIQDRTLGEVFATSSEADCLDYLQTIRNQVDVPLSLVLEYPSLGAEGKRFALEVVLKRKGLAVAVIAARNQILYSGRYPQIETELRQLRSLSEQIVELTFALPESSAPETSQQSLAKLRTDYTRLQRQLSSQIPENLLQEQLASYRDVALHLPPGTTLVEFVCCLVFDFKALPAQQEAQWKLPHYLAFILSANEPDDIQMLDLGEMDVIDRQIVSFRASIAGKSERRQFETVPMSLIPGFTNQGAELRRTLFDPIVAAIGNCKRLFLAPDGNLCRLPFEALPLDDGRYAIDEYQISYLSTGRDVLRFDVASSSQAEDPLVVADPDFDLGSNRTPAANAEVPEHGIYSGDLNGSLRFQQLEGTSREGKQVAALLGVHPWLRENVLEKHLKRHLAEEAVSEKQLQQHLQKEFHSPRLLHLATHGFFLSTPTHNPHQVLANAGMMSEIGRLSGAGLENPLLRSGLALAGANTWLQGGEPPTDAEDGILTAEDVAGLNLRDTELVVLSACETGLGDVQVGEGVFGLQRAFVLAGAKTLVMSLWQVSDDRTQELMIDFYQGILAGQPRSEALRAAQLAMKARYPHEPFYWGAFICQGNPAAFELGVRLPDD